MVACQLYFPAGKHADASDSLNEAAALFVAMVWPPDLGHRHDRPDSGRDSGESFPRDTCVVDRQE